MKIRSTSYPAIALLVSMIILISGFSLSIFGINNFLEEKREYGVELVEDFRNYNIFQFYTYVLSDYEVRRIFFNTFFKEILNKSITNGMLNATLYNRYLLENSKILGYVKNCDKVFEIVGDNLKNDIDTTTYFIYFPCFELIPIANFSTEFNKTFLEGLKINYLLENIFEKHIDTLSNKFNFSLNIREKSFKVSNEDILFRQKVRYFYKGKKETFTRDFDLDVEYSLIPNILLYNKIFSKDYSSFVEDIINKLKEGTKIIYENVSQFMNYIDGYRYIYDNYRPYIVLYKNRTVSFNNLILLGKIYNSSNFGKFSINSYYQEIYLCEQLHLYSSSNYSLNYKLFYGCLIPETPDPLKRDDKYRYLIETCLNDPYYSKETSTVDVSLAEICYYNLTIIDISQEAPELRKIPQAIASPLYDTLNNLNKEIDKIKNYYISISEGFYFWPVEDIPMYKLKIFGIYKPVKCVLGYNYEKGPYFFSDPNDCLNNRTRLIQEYGRYRDPTLFISDCELITGDTSSYYRVFVGRYSKKIESALPSSLLKCGPYNYREMYLGFYVI